jgi:HEAT repeat protein
VPLATEWTRAEDEKTDLIRMVVEILSDPDKEMRDLGFEQIRTEVKGSAATKQFAAQLSHVPADVQVPLLRALAVRGDLAARPAVLELLEVNRDKAVRLAAIDALGSLGQRDDVPRFVELLSSANTEEQQAAQRSLTRLNAAGVSQDLAARMNQARPDSQLAIIEVLSARRALETLPNMLAAAQGSDPRVRVAALSVLGQLAGPEFIPGLVECLLKEDNSAERAVAEKAIVSVCGRIADPDGRAAPLLAAMQPLNSADRQTLLSVLGHVGGAPARVVLETALADADPQQHEAGLRGLCSWPDASVAPRLIELAETEKDSKNRSIALAALIRVAPLPDQRPSSEKLALLVKTISMCTSNDERNLVLKRASAIRAVETLRFVLPYLDQEPFAQQACETIVELAHHRQLREANKAEFDGALDRVIATSKDATVVERANRYKRGQTWSRPATRDKL